MTKAARKAPRAGSKRARVLALSQSNYPPRRIASILDTPVATIYAIQTQLRRDGFNVPRSPTGAPPQGGPVTTTIELPGDVRATLAAAASKRNISHRRLIEQIIGIVLSEDMVDAVLDDRS